jgi:hypothetical protein
MGLFGPTKKGGGLDMRFKSNKGGYLGKAFGFIASEMSNETENEATDLDYYTNSLNYFISERYKYRLKVAMIFLTGKRGLKASLSKKEIIKGKYYSIEEASKITRINTVYISTRTIKKEIEKLDKESYDCNVKLVKNKLQISADFLENLIQINEKENKFIREFSFGVLKRNSYLMLIPVIIFVASTLTIIDLIFRFLLDLLIKLPKYLILKFLNWRAIVIILLVLMLSLAYFMEWI